MNTYKLSWKDKVLTWLGLGLMAVIGSSLRINEEGRSDLGPRAKQGYPILWALWHETIFTSVWYHRFKQVHVMISASRDGEIISEISHKLGYSPIRGSSSKGGLEAARELVSHVLKGNRAAITPDGPKGPRRKVQQGVVLIARLAHCPVVPFAFEVERGWRLKSWDRFIIPKPFSRAVFVYGNPITIPRKGETDAWYIEKVQIELDRITRIAENYFTSTNANL
jgi:lysophospholipid acyltransferase (LPLAT)-like uncharacterized protein